MEREQIIKALECCVSGYCIDQKCPLFSWDDEDDISKCTSKLATHSLSLIKELTQANEMLSESYDHLEKTKDELLAERSRLTEENDRLSTALAEYEHKTNIRISEEYVHNEAYEELIEENKKLTEECERLQQTIARVKKYCQTLKIRIPPMSVVTYIEQIEKEFLEVKE